MTYEEHDVGRGEYNLVAVPRPWVKEWLWRILCKLKFCGIDLVCNQPLRWMFTVPCDAEFTEVKE